MIGRRGFHAEMIRQRLAWHFLKYSKSKNMIDPTQFLQETIEYAVAVRAERIDARILSDRLKVYLWVRGSKIAVANFSAIHAKAIESAFHEFFEIGNEELEGAQKPIVVERPIEVRGNALNVRLSTWPAEQPLSQVMLFQYLSDPPLGLDQIGLCDATLAKFRKAIQKDGLVVFCGIRPGGRTTAMRAAARDLKRDPNSIAELDYRRYWSKTKFQQFAVEEDKDVASFSELLQKVGRLDPDVVMLQCLRSLETLQTAVQYGLAGHLVLAKTNVQRAAVAITRLLDMGVDPKLVASSLNGVLCCRKIRTCCICKREILIADSKEFERAYTASSRGCEACHWTGYQGQTGIFEFLEVTREMRELISKTPTTAEIQDLAVKQGMKTIRETALEKVNLGIAPIDLFTAV